MPLYTIHLLPISLYTYSLYLYTLTLYIHLLSPYTFSLCLHTLTLYVSIHSHSLCLYSLTLSVHLLSLYTYPSSISQCVPFFLQENSQNAALVGSTLETLLRFLNWIPLGYIFETNLIRSLIEKFLDVPMFRNVTLKCLTEIAGIQAQQYNAQFCTLFQMAIAKLKQVCWFFDCKCSADIL